VTQPLLGLVATAIAIGVALAYLALFDLPTFLGWVAFSMLCLIPLQIIVVVLWGANPGFAARLRQPLKGLALLAVTAIGGAVIVPIVLQIVAGGATPPGPIPSQYAVVVVPTTFFMAIAFGGWPFTAMTRNSIVAGLLVLVASYVATYLLFPYESGYALVTYVTVLAGMFLLLHFDLWPLTRSAAVMKQPVLGVVWMVCATAVALIVMRVATQSLALDPMYVLTRITAPFIFGTIIILNMLQNSVFAALKQPVKGIANAAAAMAIGAALAVMYGSLGPRLVGMPLESGAPGYTYELWLVNALLSVTFPFLIFYAAYFGFWPLAPAERPNTAQTART
jgi:hypothetical protein